MMLSIDWKNVGLQLLRLVPFFAFVILYFSLVRDDSSVALSTCLCFPPIIFLMLFVLMKGFKLTNKFQYSQFIMAGLGFSCVGNILVSLDLMAVSLVFFALTHIVYIIAPFDIGNYKFYKVVVYVIYFSIAITVEVDLFPKLSLALAIFVPIYSFLLVLMAWKGVVYLIEEPSFLSSLCAVGCTLFYVSVVLVAATVTYGTIPHARIIIMSIYYAGQCLIAVSTLCETTTVSIVLPVSSIQTPTNSIQSPMESTETPTV